MNSAILKGNGELWEIYPEMKKVKNNVKKYVADWIYKGKGRRDSIPVKYSLDNGRNPVWVYVLKKDGTLWSRQEVSAEEKSNSFAKIVEQTDISMCRIQ